MTVGGNGEGIATARYAPPAHGEYAYRGRARGSISARETRSLSLGAPIATRRVHDARRPARTVIAPRAPTMTVIRRAPPLLRHRRCGGFRTNFSRKHAFSTVGYSSSEGVEGEVKMRFFFFRVLIPPRLFNFTVADDVERTAETRTLHP